MTQLLREQSYQAVLKDIFGETQNSIRKRRRKIRAGQMAGPPKRDKFCPPPTESLISHHCPSFSYSAVSLKFQPPSWHSSKFSLGLLILFIKFQLKVSFNVCPRVPSTQFSMRKTSRLRGKIATLPTRATMPEL